ncbi:MAG TPA: ribosome small subunit-dependent GTPase A [Ktedonobacterales bacterium]|nr:ribosome small subunit-dependent GTPase A [Ktedonobacterales bacterium]
MTNDSLPEQDTAARQQANSSATSSREGLVVALAPGLFEVATADGASWLCTLRGRLRKRRPTRPLAAPSSATSPADATSDVAAEPPTRVAPGDRVRFTPLANGEGVIEEVMPRRTVLARARPEVGTEQVLLANPDQAALVFAMREPSPHFGLLDRYLALCEHAHVPALICLNKDDLGEPDEVADAERTYCALGYPVVRTSAATGDGLDALRERLAGRISLLTGPSGVGKSSLMNLLIPDARQRTGEISAATGKGRHTTTGVRLLPLPEGGWLADSAGIRELSLWQVPSEELARCFVELREVADDCEYEDCAHGLDEEGCALRAVLIEGRMTPERWASFQRLLDEARAQEGPAWATKGR